MQAAVKRLVARILALRRTASLDREFEDELQSHLVLLTEENIRHGMSPDQARRAASVRLGNVESLKEQHRDVRGFPTVEALTRDFRFAARVLLADPWVSVTTIALLSIGIGASSATFTLMNAVMLRMLPVEEPQRLVQVNRVGPGGAGPWISYPTYEALRGSAGFDGMLATNGASRWTVTVGAEPAEQTSVELGSANYFRVLRLEPLLGTLTLDPGTAVISHGYWTRRFGAAPDVLGQRLAVNGASVIVAGVTPRGFAGVHAGASTDIWLSLLMQPLVLGGQNTLEQAGHNWLRSIGRLAPDAAVAQARDAADAVFRNTLIGRVGGAPAESRDPLLAERIVLADGGFGLSNLRRTFSSPLQVLLGASGLALLITCANLAHLFLVRAARRHKETAIRLALGAARRHVVRQLLMESMLLSAVGACLGMLLGRWGTGALAGILLGGGISGALPLDLDWRVLAFTSAIAVAAGLLFGLVPALQAARTSVLDALKAGRTRRRSRAGQFLAVSQVAVALTLVSGAGLFAKSLAGIRSADLGFDAGQTVLARLDTRAASARTAAGQALRELRQRLAASPAVLSTTLSSRAFFAGGDVQRNISVRGYVPSPGADLNPFVIAVADGFFTTMGIRVLEGRVVSDRDTVTAPTVAVVNESFARYYFGAESPIGKRFGFGDVSTSGNVEIIGLVADTRDGHIREEPRHIAYVPLGTAQPPLEITLAVRTIGRPDTAMTLVRTMIHETRGLSLGHLQTMEEQIDRSLNRERLLAILAGGFGMLSLGLACLGIYGVLGYGVRNRAREFAVRVAVGASGSDIGRRIARDVLGILAIGTAAGVLMSLGTGRLAAGLLFGVSPYDLTTLTMAVAATVAAGVLGAWGPARRAARADPMLALRSD